MLNHVLRNGAEMCESKQHHAHLQLFMCLPNSLAVGFLAPVVPILPEEAHGSSIEEKKRTTYRKNADRDTRLGLNCAQQHLQGE